LGGLGFAAIDASIERYSQEGMSTALGCEDSHEALRDRLPKVFFT